MGSSICRRRRKGWIALAICEEAIFGGFDVTHYRPKDRPNAVRVLHPKNGEENWVSLFDDGGTPLYLELMAELDAIKRERIGGLMTAAVWGERRP